MADEMHSPVVGSDVGELNGSTSASLPAAPEDDHMVHVSKVRGRVGYTPLDASADVDGGDGGNGGGKAKTVADFHQIFVKLINKEMTVANASSTSVADLANLADVSHPSGSGSGIVDAKANNGANGLETSTFTICTRIRPMLPDERTNDGENFECVFFSPPSTTSSTTPSSVVSKAASSTSKPMKKKRADTSEDCVVFKPKVAFTGKPKLEKEVFALDKTFGPGSSNVDVYAVCRPLVLRAIEGQVGTIVAFGQTGSGKTHTMNGIMDALIADLFSPDIASITGGFALHVSFRYIEILGSTIKDCLSPRCSTSAGMAMDSSADARDDGGSVQLGELLDGTIALKNVTEHVADTAEEMHRLVAIAKAYRSTAATERNAESSRSHGVGILTIGYKDSECSECMPSSGVLYVVDLAGSERMADSKYHDSDRMDETKAINLSLMGLKECIRARTLASAPGAAATHVPYRRSKLTLLMKDCFDISCARLCSTVVLAHVSPLARDVSHSLNTLKYAAPLRVAMANKTAVERDERDPATWSHESALAWLTAQLLLPTSEHTLQVSSEVASLIAASLLPSSATGLQLCQTSELRMHTITVANGGSAQLGKAAHAALWMAICDAKTRKRRPNGTLMSAGEEEAEAEAVVQRQREQAELWSQREEQLKSNF